MATEQSIRERGIDFDEQQSKSYVDYKGNHQRLVELVDEFGAEKVSLATEMKLSTVKQHYRAKNGQSMISTYRIERAEYALSEL